MSYVNNETAYAAEIDRRQAATEDAYWSWVYSQMGTPCYEPSWREPESGRDCSFYPTWVCEGEDSRVVAQRAAA